MAEYCIRILKAAAQDLERLDKPTGRRIVQRINWLAANVDAIRLEALTGDFAGLYKLRVGDYRIIYEVLWDEETIVIHAVGHRREIYRRRWDSKPYAASHPLQLTRLRLALRRAVELGRSASVELKTKILLPFILLLSFHSVLAQDNPTIPDVDRTRLAEVFRLGETIGNRIWKDWDKAPFAVLLVTPENEFLIRHPKPSPDFTLIGYDPLLKSDVYFRKRTFPIDLLAAMPAIRGSIVSTIVVGQPENTSAQTSTPWIVTLLHEHFHQLQSSQPNYYTDVNALNLSRGDQTGMWMLNFAFPYDKAEVQEQFSTLSKLLMDVLESKSKAERSMKLAAYLQARQRFQQMLSPDDYKYFSFQLWQEGIARYTEYQVAKLAAAKYRPSREFRALKDYTSFAQVADAIRERIFKQLQTQKLGESQRVAFYSFGAAEGLLLDKANPQWRTRYFVDKFDISKYYNAAR